MRHNDKEPVIFCFKDYTNIAHLLLFENGKYMNTKMEL